MDIGFVGWRGRAVEATGTIGVHLEPVDLCGELPAQLAAIVLGRGVLDMLDPGSVSIALERFGGAVLIVWEPDGASPWSEESARRIGETVDPERALQRSLEVVRRRPLARMPLSEWFGQGRFALAPGDRELVRLVPRLPRLRGYEWAKAAGLSEHRLSCATRRLLGMTAGSALRDYRLRAVHRMRARGRTMQEIAPVLGYASRASVCRAMHLHATRWSGRVS